MCDSLPILYISRPLRQLRPRIDEMACEKERIFRGDGEGVAHKGCGVDGQGAGHAAGYSRKAFPNFMSASESLKWVIF